MTEKTPKEETTATATAATATAATAATTTAATSSTPGGMTLQRRVHVLLYGLGVEGWVSVGLIVLLQWFLVDQGQWQGLPPGLQKIVYGVVLYSTLVDLAMSYSVDLLACAQSLIRLYVIFGIAALFPTTQSIRIVYPCMLVIWSVNQVVAYAYAAAQAWCINPKDIPPALTDARFSWFRFLYPISVFLEVLMAYLAMPLAKEWNKTYSLVMVLGAFAYLPGFPKLFQNMLVERRKYVQRLYLEKNK